MANHEGKQETFTADWMLTATGRRPNVDKLDIEKTGIKCNARGTPVANKCSMQTSIKHIFIAGDDSNQLPLLHKAYDQGAIAGDNAGHFPHNARPGLRRTTLSAVCCDPQITTVGKSYWELEERVGSCGCFAQSMVSFENQGRSRVMLRNRGMLCVSACRGSGCSWVRR